jgi:hypothetical protein
MTKSKRKSRMGESGNEREGISDVRWIENGEDGGGGGGVMV